MIHKKNFEAYNNLNLLCYDIILLYSTPLSQELIDNLNMRRAPIIEENELMAAGLFLDPRFRSRLLSSELTDVKKMIRKVYNRMQEISPSPS